MTVRVEVQTLVGAGPFPSADDATEEELDAIVRWLEQIPRPVTDEEAHNTGNVWVQEVSARVDNARRHPA